MSHWNEGIRGQTCDVLVAVVSLNDSRCTDVRLSACLGTSGSLKIHFGVFVISGEKKKQQKKPRAKKQTCASGYKTTLFIHLCRKGSNTNVC